MFDTIKDTLTTQLLYSAESIGIPIWLVILVLIAFSFIIPMLTAFLITRSKNFAQKRDIEDLTRKTEAVKTEFIKYIEYLKHEHLLINHTYELFVENIMEYYSTFYEHYIRCSRTANYDTYIPKGGVPIGTSDIFEDHLEDFSIKWNNQLGKIKILLPNTLLKLHTIIELQLNEFRDIVMNRNNYLINQTTKNAYRQEYKDKLVDIFKKIDKSKNQMENEIRRILKVNKLKSEIKLK